MDLIEFSVKRYQFTVVVFLMLVALGVSSLFAIPKAEDPTFPYPNFTVVAVYPGSSPADIEKLIVDPIESKLKALDDVKTLKTEISDGLAVIAIEFTAGTDADKKYDDVLRELNALRSDLPSELQSLKVEKFNAADVNILQVALVSETASYRELAERADRLRKRLENQPGVKEAKRSAFPSQEVRVSLDLERLASLGVTPLQVISAIQATNVNIPAGSVDIGQRKFNVKTSGDYSSLAQVEDTVVASAKGSLVRLRDVAEVAVQDEDINYLGRFNGQRAVFVTANMKERQNIFQVREALWKELDAMERELPSGMRLERGFDQSRNVSERLNGFSRDFAIAIFLVLLTLLPLGLRASAVVMISIPLSLAIGVALLHLTGFTINQLSIVGFVIALGLLVDDSIVVVENISRFLRKGYRRREAAILATRQIGVSVIGCTATLIFAFLPLLFLPGAPGLFIRSMPVAVVFTILASLVVSLTIIPFLASLLLAETHQAEGNVFMRGLMKLVDGSYRRVLHTALSRPRATLAVAAALFIGSLALIPAVGFSLFPKAGLPQFRVTVETPDGSSLGETDRAVRFVEGVLARVPEVKNVMANVGHGNPRVYYNVPSKNEKNNVGELFVQLQHLDARHATELFDRLRQRFDGYPNAKIELREFEQGPPLDAPIAMRVIGERLDVLDTVAAEVEAVMLKTPGTAYVRNPSRDRKTDLRVNIDRDKAGLYGVQLVDVDRSVRMGLAGIQVGRYRADGQVEDAFNVNVALPRAAQKQSLDALSRVYVPASSGAQVPLGQLSGLEFEASPATINHFNKERSVTITADVLTGYNTDRVTRAAAGPTGRVETATRLPHRGGRRNRKPTGELRGPRLGHHRRRLRCAGSAGPGVPDLQEHPHRRLRHPARHHRRRAGPLPVRQHPFLHRHHRLRCPVGHRGEELHPAGGLHQPAASEGHGGGRGH